MLKGLLTFGLTRQPLVLLALLVFLGAGLFAFSRLNIEAYPNPAPVILEITAQAAGLSAEEMERYYTIPIEVGLAATPGVDVIRSTSFYGLSFVRVTFNYGVDYYFALTQTAINLQQNVSLPNNATPTIQATSLVGEIYRYQVVGPPHFGLTNLRTIQEWIVQRRLLTVPGVVQVNTWGGTTKEYDVDVDLNKLDAYGVTLPEVISAIGNANINVGGRTINIGQQSVNIRGVGLMNSGGSADLTQGYHVDDIENVPLGQSNGVPVLVKDVANVSVGYVPRVGKAGRDRQDDIVAAIVIMNRTLHTNDVVPRVRAEIQKINTDGTLPPGVKLVPYYDRSTLVAVTTSTVLHNLIYGCVLIFLIQWIFLGDLRSAIMVAANIPFALFFSVIILVLRGEDANLLSVGAVDFGIIVDAAVIFVENVYRNFQSIPEDREKLLQGLAAGRWGSDPTRDDTSGTTTWTDRLRLILISGLQIDRAVFFSTAIIVAAFVPLFTMQGVEGQIFGPMARTYAYALVGALLATFTVTPCLASLLIPVHVSEVETIVVRGLRSVYTPVLRWSLNNKKFTTGIGVIFVVFSLFLGSRLGSEFLPPLEEGNLWIRATMPPTISLEAGMPIVTKIREIIRRHPEVVTVTSQQGRPDDGSDAAGFSNAEFFVPLKPFEDWPVGYTKDKLIEDLLAEFANEFVGIDFNFSQYIQDNVEEGLSGVKGANSVKIIGPDLATLEKIARSVLAEMEKVRGITDLGAFWVLGQPNLNIQIDRQKAARYGLSVNDVNSVVQAALGGATATTLLESDRQFGVVVRLAPEYRSKIEDVRNIKVGYQTPSGVHAYIPLSQLAHISLDTGASYIFRERNQRYIPIKFSVRDRDLAGAVAEAQERIARNVRLPSGYRIDWAGEFEWLEQAKQRLAIIVPITFVLIIVLLYGLFNSWRASMLALLGLPFTISGGLVALYVSGLNFSISAAIGFISLLGVSVMSGILIINGYYRVAATGMAPLEAMFHAVEDQMRPILMMTLSACIGLLPAAISTGIGSQVQRPLATVIVGGMLIGPIMLLVIVPALQTLFLRDQHQTPPAPNSGTQ
ncbi:MAG: CusA/CzcA family heavy metal efflux RND transporter [Xanthobacteraceae bacterium]